MSGTAFGWLSGTLRRLTAAAAAGGILIGLLLYVATANTIKDGLARSLAQDELCSATRQLRDTVIAHVRRTSPQKLPPPIDAGALDVVLPDGAGWWVNLGDLSTTDDATLQAAKDQKTYFAAERQKAASYSDGDVQIEPRGSLIVCSEYHDLTEPRFQKYRRAVYSFAWEKQRYQHTRERYREITSLAVDRLFLVLIAFSVIAGVFMIFSNEFLVGPFLRGLKEEVAGIKEGRQKQVQRAYPQELEIVKNMINVLIETLERSREETTRVAGKMAHDLNNKMQVIIGAASATDVEPEQIKRAVARAFDVLERYRVILSSVANRTPFPTTVNLLAFVSDIVIAQMFNLYNRNVIYRVNGQVPDFSTPESDIAILFRKADLDIILTNLVTNATKYGGGEVDVDVSWDERHFYLTVSDNGPGIPPDKKAMIFEEGYRLEVDVERPGSGFGLPIVRWMVDQCDGQISVETSKTGGAAFALRFPIARPAEA